MKNRIGLVVALGLALALTGCAKQKAETVATWESKLADKEATIAQMKTEVSELEAAKAKAESEARAKADAVTRAEAEVLKAKQTCVDCEAAQKMASRDAAPTGAGMTGGEMLPPNAKAGECYTRVLVPPTYTTATERVLKREASATVDVIPAKYEWAEERQLVREASTRLEVIPAEYGWAEEKVLVKEASTKLVQVPAEYAWEEEKILVKEAQTVWKKGRGPIEKVSDSTGEIMCLVEVPAEYRTVRKKVLKKAPGTTEIAIPAEYKTVKRKIVTKAPSTREIQIPADYTTVKIQRLVTPAKEVRKEIPAEYETVTRQNMASDARMEWRPILCETNMNRTTISDIQRGLQKAGFSPGPIDGIYGSQTSAALQSYQKANNLAVGGLTINTLKKLGVRI